jgi:hypothetical protein
MSEDDEWEQMKREETWFLDRFLGMTDAQVKERQQHIKARGYGNTWTERRELGTFGGPRVVLGPAQLDEDDVLIPWSDDGDDEDRN